jgi:hypothetical protein
MKLQNTKIYSIAGLFFLGLCSVASTVSALEVGPAPASYGEANHSTTNWQELDDASNVADSYGVTWSTDGGATWGRYDLQVGQTVQFKFNMHKQWIGTHHADHLKAWVDWNQDGDFDTSEALLYKEHVLKDHESTWTDRFANPNSGKYTPDEPDFHFLSGEHLITDSFVGMLWLRARVTCSESLVVSTGQHKDNQYSWSTAQFKAAFLPTGDFWQGESEDWGIQVNPVPIPAAVWLFGSGLAGMIGFSKRKKAS